MAGTGRVNRSRDLDDGPHEPSDDVKAKQDPDHDEDDFLADLEKVTQQLDPDDS